MLYQKDEGRAKYIVVCPVCLHTSILVTGVYINEDERDPATGYGPVAPSYGNFRRLWPEGSNMAFGTEGVPLTMVGFEIPKSSPSYKPPWLWPGQDTDLDRVHCRCTHCRFQFDLDLLIDYGPNPPHKVPYIQKAVHGQGFTIQKGSGDTIWKPARDLPNGVDFGYLIVANYKSFYQNNNNATMAYYQFNQTKKTFVAWFDNATGERIA
jgi:hypothetical protein